MPSIPDMSLIWNELGSYIKGSHKAEKTGDTKQHEEEISSSTSYIKEADNPVESDNTLPKKNSLNDVKQNNEKPYTSNEIKCIVSSNEVVVDLKEHSKLTTSKSSSTDILTRIHSVEVIAKKDSKTALDGKCITAKHELDISDNLHTKTNSSRALPNKNNKPTLDLKNSSVLQNKDNEEDFATEKDKEKSPKEKFEKPAEISSIKTQIKNVLVQCDKEPVDATTKPIEKEEAPKKTKGTIHKHSGAKEKDAAKCDTTERSRNSSDQELHSKKATTRDAFSASRSSSLLGKKRESSKSVPRKSDYGKRALCTSDTDGDTSDDDSTSEDEDKKIENKKGPKNEEKCTIKKRRKQYKSVDTPSKNQQTPVKDKVAPENKELEDKDQASSSHKKSKIGAKRKPTDASRGSFSQESEEIKRLKHGELETDEDSSDDSESQSDQSDTDDQDEEISISPQKVLPEIKSASHDGNEPDEQPCSIASQQLRENEIITNSRPFNPTAFGSVFSGGLPKSYEGALSPTCRSPEHLKSQEEKETEFEESTKKEFNDASKLREDQRSSMKRAKDLLKAAFSESDSDSECSENEDRSQSESKSLSDSDIDIS